MKDPIDSLAHLDTTADELDAPDARKPGTFGKKFAKGAANPKSKRSYRSYSNFNTTYVQQTALDRVSSREVPPTPAWMIHPDKPRWVKR